MAEAERGQAMVGYGRGREGVGYGREGHTMAEAERE